MRPKLQLLDKALIERIIEEAFQLIEDPGARSSAKSNTSRRR
jgi:hypothetical protein